MHIEQPFDEAELIDSITELAVELATGLTMQELVKLPIVMLKSKQTLLENRLDSRVQLNQLHTYYDIRCSTEVDDVLTHIRYDSKQMIGYYQAPPSGRRKEFTLLCTEGKLFLNNPARHPQPIIKALEQSGIKLETQ